MSYKSIIGATCTCLTIVSFNTNAALIPVLGGQAFYDPAADLTWLADANAAGTAMNWADANDWAAGLDVAGVTGWRLPDTVDVGNDGASYTYLFQGLDYGYNITTPSELSNMFYNVLGNTAYYDTSGRVTGCTAPDYCLTNTGPFSNIQSLLYWSATEYAPNIFRAWSFSMASGIQKTDTKSSNMYAWAVQSGDVRVPAPAAVWLFGSGLIGLIGVARRKKA